MSTSPRRPQLPRFLSLPLRVLPGRLHGAVAASVLDRVFAEQRSDGELDFLEGKSFCIRVLDTGVDVRLAYDPNGFRSLPDASTPDLVIEGTTYDFLQLTTAREDPDTLFFQRRLRLSGDAALGVHLKNFIASVDMDSLPYARIVRPGLERGLGLYERLFR